MECHATTVPAESLKPDPRFFGVGCEACHGPGQAHVNAARTRDLSGFKMAKLSDAGGEKINELCGNCHRTAKQVAKGDTSTQRFQPYGLSKSKCYLGSQDKLSCLTCHDPHKDASRDIKAYEAVCIRCHTPASNTPTFGPSQGRTAVCSVNTKTGCVECHMP